MGWLAGWPTDCAYGGYGWPLLAAAWRLLQPWMRTEGGEGARGASSNSTGLHPLRTRGTAGPLDQGGSEEGREAPPSPPPPRGPFTPITAGGLLDILSIRPLTCLLSLRCGKHWMPLG